MGERRLAITIKGAVSLSQAAVAIAAHYLRKTDSGG